ncbi:MAG: hypothetical protein ACRDLN_08430 [Solirubrobacteraceae bacterium]
MATADLHAIEHWGHADAGGTWTSEDLLGWLQMDVRTAARHRELPASDRTRLLPIQSSLTVVEQALERIGSVELTEVDAIVPLGFMADAAGRLAVGRDWLQLGSGDAGRQIAVHVDVDAPRDTPLDVAGIVECMTALGGEVLGPIDVRPRDPDANPAGPPAAQFVGRSFSAGATRLACATHRWSVDFAAWTIELVAHACRRPGVEGGLLVAVRREDA